MKTEKRYFKGDIQVETREDGKESRKITGYAAVFDKWSHNLGGWFREKIDRSAFDGVLDQDTVALFNHNSNFILARNNTTLQLSVDDEGLKYEFEAPNTTAGNDLLESVKRGDITGSSFQFTIEETSWKEVEGEDWEEERTIIKVKNLIDVGPVTFPAYPDTSVAKRSDYADYPNRKPPTPKTVERDLLQETINIRKRK